MSFLRDYTCFDCQSYIGQHVALLIYKVTWYSINNLKTITMQTFKKIIFLLGDFLLAINIYGLFKSLRNPEIYTEEKTLRNRISDITIRYPQIKDSLLGRIMNQIKILPLE